jgi:hypothetical protein
MPNLIKTPAGLKPCPFCGAKARYWLVSSARGLEGAIGCGATRCHIRPEVRGTEGTAVLMRRWNKRPSERRADDA